MPRSLLSSRREQVATWAVYAVVVVLCGLVAYWAMFSVFSYYDDEGFFDYSLHLFVNGHHLYNTISSAYGPFYYEFFRGVYAVLGQAVTTDAGRFIQLTLWVGSALGIGVAVHRLTGRLTIALAALATSFSLLTVLTNEPMHASALICGLLVAMALVISFGLPRAPRGSLVAVGALAAAILLTKINVGAYAIIAIVFAVVIHSSTLVRLRALRALAMAAFVLVGPALMTGKLNTPWGRMYALLVGLSAASVALVAMPTDERPARSAESARWPWYLLGGFVACAAAVIVIIVALGTTPAALINQTIIIPAHQSQFLTIPLPLGDQVLWWTLASTAVAWTLRQAGIVADGVAGRAGVDAHVHRLAGPLRLFAGAAILLSLTGQFPFDMGVGAPFALALPLVWVAALPSARDRGDRERFARLLLVAVAVLQPLMAFPVAGSQAGEGSILLAICGALCLADGAEDVLAWARARPGPRPTAAAAASALFLVLAIGTAYQFIVQPLQRTHQVYRAGVPVRVAGASLLRLPASSAAGDEAIVAALRANCRSVIPLPGLYSFNLWSGLPTPSPIIAEQPYWRELSNEQQRQVVATARATKGVCLLRNDPIQAVYGPLPRSPLIAFLDDDFVPVTKLGDYAIEKRRGA